MLCVVVPEVEDGDFSYLKGFGVERSLERNRRETREENRSSTGAIFPQKNTSLRFQTSQHKGRKIFDSSRTFQSKIHPNGPELVLEENQNPTVFERLECVAKFIRASPRASHEPSRRLPLSDWTIVRQSSNQRGTVAGTYKFCYEFQSLEYCGILIFFED